MKTGTVSRPVMRYHGGKWMLAPWIIKHLPKHRIYVEPFGGAASVLMRKPRSYAEVYNDLDGEIVNVFRVMRDPEQCRELKIALTLTPFAREEFELSYKPSDEPIEQARRTIYRTFAGFGSNANARLTGFRSNSNRSGTTPAHDWANYPEQLEAFCERLGGVVIENRDAFLLIPQHDTRETLFFVDPPYVAETRDSGRDYTTELSYSDHVALFCTLKKVEGMVVLCGYPSELYSDLYRDWTCISRDAMADGARKRTECLWINRAAQDRLQRSLFETREETNHDNQ